MTNILDSLMEQVSPNVLSEASKMLGENQSGITKAMGGLLPAILGGMVNKTSDSSAMSNIFNLLTDNKNQGLLDNVGGLLSNAGSSGIGSGLLNMVLGNKTAGILDIVTSMAGIKRSSSSTLLNFAAPLIMGWLGKKIKTDGLDAIGLGKFLNSQKSNITSALPAGMDKVLGFSTPQVQTPKSGGLMKWLLPLLLVGAAFYFFRNGCNPAPVVDDMKDTMENVAEKTTETAGNAVEAVKDATAGLGDFFSKKLACSGVELNIPSNGIEANVINFIDDASKAADKDTWFNFDRLTFATGSANLDMEKSNEQLDNIAKILKCYKNVNIKIGGYTDNTGNADNNVKLSQARAESVKVALVGLGVDAARMDAEGYGDQHPVASNETEEGRAQNRRIALRITSK